MYFENIVTLNSPKQNDWKINIKINSTQMKKALEFVVGKNINDNPSSNNGLHQSKVYKENDDYWVVLSSNSICESEKTTFIIGVKLRKNDFEILEICCMKKEHITSLSPLLGKEEMPQFVTLKKFKELQDKIMNFF